MSSSRPQDSQASSSPNSPEFPSRAQPPVSSPSPAFSEGYPSWLPQRPPPPEPHSTIQSSTGNMFASAAATQGAGTSGSDAPAIPEPSASVPPLWGGRKPTPRSVRIVKTREPTDQTRVAAATPRVWSRATAPTLAAQAARASRPRFRTPGLHPELLRDPSWLARLHFFLFPFLVLAHVPLQTFFDFNVAFVLVEIAKFPNPVAAGVPGSGSGWALAAAAYVACWFFWLFGVFLGYELVYSFYRRWRYRRPLIMPLYLSAPAFNFVSMTSYNNFCFFQHIRAAAVPHGRAHAVLPSAEGAWRDALAESFYFYSQNLPTVALLLPRAGITLAVLLGFWSPTPLPDGQSLANVSSAVSMRDGTFFDSQTGGLSGYAKGVLAASAAWAAWRILVLLISWLGLWFFSGFGCGGFCGPATRWEEEENVRAASMYSEKDVEADNEFPWAWKECTALRIQEAYDFCLTLQRPASMMRKEATDITAAEQDALDSEGVNRVLAAVGLAPPLQHPSRRPMLSQDLFESPPHEAEDVEAQGEQADQGPYPFQGFGQHRDSSSSQQVPFPPSPGPIEGEHEGEEGEEEYEEYEEEESVEPRTSQDVPSSGRASNSMSSLGQPIPGRYPFTFRHPASRGGSVSSMGAFSASARSHHTPQSKSTSSKTHSTGGSRVSRSTGNAETSSDSPASGHVGDSSNAPSPQGMNAHIPMPPRHPAPRAGRGRSGTVPMPVSPSPAVYYGRARAGTHTTSAESATDLEPSIVYESEFEDGVVGTLDLTGITGSLRGSVRSGTGASLSAEQRTTGSASPSPESILALEREGEDSVGLLSAGPSPRGSSVGLRSRNSSDGSHSRSRSGSSRSRHGSHQSARSRHGSHLSVSSAGLGIGGASNFRARTTSLIHSIGSASRSSLERVRSRAQSLVRIEDLDERSSASFERERRARESAGSPYMSEVSERVSSPENYTFGQRLAGAAGLQSTRPRAPTESSVDPQSDVEGEGKGSGSGSAPHSQPAHSLREAPSNVSGGSQPSRPESFSEQTVSVRIQPSDEEREPQTPVVDIPGRQQQHLNVDIPGQSHLGVGVRASNDMLGSAAPSFITQPTIMTQQTDSSGRTPSSWGDDDYMRGSAFKPR
ncbi:hypothetical protein PENSPDRAFT_688528 [Peniophora sp. CONT]|nr:hypothetical protein PENSPDRAFT_688528 [Peniophora sp. CONT]